MNKQSADQTACNKRLLCINKQKVFSRGGQYKVLSEQSDCVLEKTELRFVCFCFFFFFLLFILKQTASFLMIIRDYHMVFWLSPTVSRNKMSI